MRELSFEEIDSVDGAVSAVSYTHLDVYKRQLSSGTQINFYYKQWQTQLSSATPYKAKGKVMG